MIWQWNKIQSNCEIIHCLWVHLVAIMWFARLYCFRINNGKESQGECLRSVNHNREHAAGRAPPPRSARALTWSDGIKLKLQTMAEGQQGGKIPIPRLAPPLPISKRRKKKSFEEKQCKKKELDRARNKTRINIGASFRRWRELQILQGLKSDAELAALLLDK